MADDSSSPSGVVHPVGTRVVARVAIRGGAEDVLHPKGAVGLIVASPTDLSHNYRVRFPDGTETAIGHQGLMTLSDWSRGEETGPSSVLADRVIFRCVVGSRAFGLDTAESDTDRRGIYLPPADMHWSLHGVPEQLENTEAEEVYWELQKFITLALKANPNILECLYSPIVEKATPMAEELLAMRDIFLSRLVYQTYSGYAISQFRKTEADLRNHGTVRWKHAMHLIRLLMAGTALLRDGVLSVDVGEEREALLAIGAGEMAWQEIKAWHDRLQADFRCEYQATRLPERPDHERANAFLLKARRAAIEEGLP